MKYKSEIEHMIAELRCILAEPDSELRWWMVAKLIDETVENYPDEIYIPKHPDPIIRGFGEICVQISDDLEYYNAIEEVRRRDLGIYFGDDKLEEIINGYIERLKKLLTGEVA